MVIKAKRIIAENVAEVQQIGGTAADAAALMKAMRGLELGTIEADEILAGNLGLFQHIAPGAQVTAAALLREVAGIRGELEVAVTAGQLPAPQAQQALTAAKEAEAELAKPMPDKKQATDKLGKMAEAVKKTTEASENLEKLGGRLVKLAPAAMGLWKLAQAYLGG